MSEGFSKTQLAGMVDAIRVVYPEAGGFVLLTFVPEGTMLDAHRPDDAKFALGTAEALTDAIDVLTRALTNVLEAEEVGRVGRANLRS